MPDGATLTTINWDTVASAAISGLALIAAIWLGTRQINIASRQADISAEQAVIASEQNAISERQTTIMESQANLERFHALRDDLSVMLDLEEFLQSLKFNLVETDWKALRASLAEFRMVEIRSSRVIKADKFRSLSIVLDTVEFLIQSRKWQGWQIKRFIYNKENKTPMLFERAYADDNPRSMIIYECVKEIRSILDTITEKRRAIYEIAHGDAVDPTLQKLEEATLRLLEARGRLE